MTEFSDIGTDRKRSGRYSELTIVSRRLMALEEYLGIFEASRGQLTLVRDIITTTSCVGIVTIR